MVKISSLFKRDPDTGLATDQVTKGCEWALKGQGQATKKIDGTACRVKDGRLWRRYTLKTGKGRKIPKDFEPADPESIPDKDSILYLSPELLKATLDKIPGWVPVGGTPDDKFHREAFDCTLDEDDQTTLEDWTYELIGPRIQGNPYGLSFHTLVKHGSEPVPNFLQCVTFYDVRGMMTSTDAEGIVWWHPDGRKCKAKRRDFGLKWPIPAPYTREENNE